MRPSFHFALFSLGFAAAETQTSVAERDCIALCARDRRTAAEIGVWHGVTTCRIAESLAPGGVVYAVDNYRQGRLGFSFPQQVARRNTRNWRDKIQFVRATGEQAAAEFKRDQRLQFEFVFIDGDHSYEGLRKDWEAWAPLIARGGMVALHDSRSTATRDLQDAGSCIFTREVIRRDKRFELIEEVDSLSVLRLRVP